jgi:ketosteroid isomerase-like protein
LEFLGDVMNLPEAAAAERGYFSTWLETFAGFVRDVDYASARPLFHPDVLAFGTHRDVISGIESWVATQWDNVWPRTADFRFDIAATRILVSPDQAMACVIAPWTSTGLHPDGTRFDRPGRATMIFHRDGEDWICTHSHMSLNRGVPQESHANRPVRAR